VAAGVANRMVELLNEFNLDRRQVQSREQRRFTGERTQQTQEELRAAEAALLRFLQSNREYAGSPLLEYQHSRLQRDVQVKQEIYLTLTKAYEEARIAEVRDIPVLTIIDEAVPPVLRSSPRRKLNTMMGLLLGGIAGLVIVLLSSGRTAAVKR
jgi:tyrosine-protein kinase Etk/Wzc